MHAFRLISPRRFPTASMPPTTDTLAAESPPAPAGRLTPEQLFLAEESRLLRLAFAVTGDFAAAQDIVQDAFLRLHGVRVEIAEPRAWLATVVRRLAIDHLRRRKPAASVDTLADTPADETPRGGDERAESLAALRVCLAELAPRDRELVRLKFDDDLDYAGIAARTGLSVGNVGYRLHHALKRLSAAMLRIRNGESLKSELRKSGSDLRASN